MSPTISGILFFLDSFQSLASLQIVLFVGAHSIEYAIRHVIFAVHREVANLSGPMHFQTCCCSKGMEGTHLNHALPNNFYFRNSGAFKNAFNEFEMFGKKKNG